MPKVTFSVDLEQSQLSELIAQVEQLPEASPVRRAFATGTFSFNAPPSDEAAVIFDPAHIDEHVRQLAQSTIDIHDEDTFSAARRRKLHQLMQSAIDIHISMQSAIDTHIGENGNPQSWSVLTNEELEAAMTRLIGRRENVVHSSTKTYLTRVIDRYQKELDARRGPSA